MLLILVARVSYYSATLEDWMLVADDTAVSGRAAWLKSGGYVQQRREGVYVATAPAAAAGYGQPMAQYWKQAINDTALAATAAVRQVSATFSLVWPL